MTGAASTKPPAIPTPFSTVRRETFSTLIARMDCSKPRIFFGFVMIFMRSHSRRCEMDGVFDALVSAAAADVARHRVPYLIAGRFWILDQQRDRLHDLTSLAIAALRNVQLAPGLLNRMVAGQVKAFDRRDLPADHIGNRRDAGADGVLIDHNRAGAAERLAAAKFGACQANFIAEKPE